MSKIQVLMPIILVIFPRRFGLALRGGNWGVVCLHNHMYVSPIMERHGKNNFMIIRNTDRDVRKIEPDEIKLNLQMSLDDELGS